MKTEIEYAVNIVVGVVIDGEFHWYVTRKEWWFLDLVKFERAFLDAGYSLAGVQGNYSNRFDIAILNGETAHKFLSEIHEYRVTIKELKQLVLEQEPVTDIDDILEYYPSLLVDFDQQILKSWYPEPASFEEFVPDGWRGVEIDFLDDVPAEKRYWLINGRNYFEAWSKIPQKAPLVSSAPPQSGAQKPRSGRLISQTMNLFSSDEHKAFMDVYYRVKKEFADLSFPRGERDFLKELSIMRREYLARLPVCLLARCPICGGSVWEPIDTFSLNGLGWTRSRTGDGWFGLVPVTVNMTSQHRWVNSTGETHSFTAECDHVRIITVSLNLNGLQPNDVTAPYSVKVGSEKPFVMKPLMDLDQTYIVIHSVPVWRFYNRDSDLHYTAYFVTYFTAASEAAFTTVMQPAYENYTSILYDWMDYDLRKWVTAGKILWLDASNPDFPLRSKQDQNFPYGNVQGGEGVWEIHEGQMKLQVGRSRKWSGGELEQEMREGFFSQLKSVFRDGRGSRKK